MTFNQGRFDPKYKNVCFLQDADNVYRTENYIVKQQIELCYDINGTAIIMSNDTYYTRRECRDSVYEEIFFMKGSAINGKRIQSATYTRTYVD